MDKVVLRKNKGILKRDILDDLYNKQGKTLQEIGDIYNITRERIRQIMAKLGVKYARPILRKPCEDRYKSIEEYFLSGPRKRDHPYILRRFFPEAFCAECGSKKHLHFHHISYPPVAVSINDIQVLCASCHKIKHSKGMTLIRQGELYLDYRSGIPYHELMKKYNLSHPMIYKIIKKIRRGWHTYRG